MSIICTFTAPPVFVLDAPLSPVVPRCPLNRVFHSAVLPCLQSSWLMHTGKPTGVAVSHCITWSQTQLIFTTCQIRYHSHLWDHRSTGQLCTLFSRGGLEYHMMSRVRQLILVGVSVCPLEPTWL